MAEWQTVAVIGPNYRDHDRLLATPFELAKDLFIGPLERWPVPDFVQNSLSPYQQLDLRAATNALVVRYQDAAIAERTDPNVSSEKDLEAERRLRLANLALWLARPTALSVWLVASVEIRGKEREWRGHRLYEVLIPVDTYQGDNLTLEDLTSARRSLAGLESAPREGAVWIASTLLVKALRERDEGQRLLLLWIAIESLFGPEDSREITYRLAHRVGFFLGSTRAEGGEISRKVKSGYAWRSRIVHGMRVGKVARDDSRELVMGAEDVLRRSLNKILADAKLIEIFSGKAREGYLDDLPFRDG